MAIIREIIQGNLGKVRELRELNGGNAVINFSVAVTPRKKSGNEWVDDETIWTEVTLWGQQARNFASSDVKPGTAVIVVGVRKARRAAAYTTKENVEVPERVEQFINAESVAIEINYRTVIPKLDFIQQSGGQSGIANSQQGQSNQTSSQTQQTEKPKVDTDDLFGSADSTSISQSDDIFGSDF